MRRLLSLTPALLAASACAYNDPPGGAPMPLLNSAGQSIGSVTAYQSGGGVTLKITASGMTHGLHGIHVHQVGRCDGPDFKSAGSHWNPTDKQHGFINPKGAHGGDLPNVSVSSNGVLMATLTVANADITKVGGDGALIDADGAAVVVHAKPDDYATDPSGNSGDRVACAVLVPTAIRY